MPSSSSLGSPHVGWLRACDGPPWTQGGSEPSHLRGGVEGAAAENVRARSGDVKGTTHPRCLAAAPELGLEREFELEVRPVARARLQDKLRQIEAAMCGAPPTCTGCGGGMKNRGRKRSSFVTRFGTMELRPVTYLCAACRRQVRPALERPRGEAGHLSGCLARLLALLAIVVPYAMAAQLACHFFGIDVSAMAVRSEEHTSELQS